MSLVAHAAIGAGLRFFPSFDEAPPEPTPIRVFLEKSVEPPGVASAAPPPAPAPAPKRAAPKPKPAAPTPPRVAEAPPPVPVESPVPAVVPPAPEPAGASSVSGDVASGPPAASGGGTEVASLGSGSAASGTGRGGALDPEAEIRAYIDLVRKRIEAKKRYPALAKSRGTEGTVVALLHLGASGNVDQVEIVDSPSGLLSDPTREAILAAGPFPAPPGELRRIRVPVRYRLD